MRNPDSPDLVGIIFSDYCILYYTVFMRSAQILQLVKICKIKKSPVTVFYTLSMCGREPDIRVEGNFTKNRYWFLLNTGQKIAQVHPKEELRGPKVFPTVKGILSRDE